MSLNSLLRQNITIENPNGTRDKQGRDSFGENTAAKARIQLTHKVIVTAEKEREPIDAIVFVAPSTVIEKSSRVTYAGEKYRVMKLEPVPGKNGQTHHFELMLQLWSYKAAA
jgi:head-tail adaptor